MNSIDHSLWIRETLAVKLESTPLVIYPIVPIHNDIVDRKVTLAETSQCVKYLSLSLIALTTLPETEQPVRHDLRLACEGSVTANNLVSIFARDEIIVELLSHFAPEANLLLLSLIHRLKGSQSAISLATVRLPFQTDGVCLSCLKINGKLSRVRIPSGSPYLLVILACVEDILGIYRLAVDVNLLIARVIVRETILASLLWSYASFIYNGSIIEPEFREILCRFQIFEVDAILSSDQSFLTRSLVSAGKSSFFSVLVAKCEYFVQLTVVLWITET